MTAPPAPQRVNRLPLIIALVLGLAIGTGGMGVYWALSSLRPGGGAARSDALASCEVIGRVETLDINHFESLAVHRVAAASELALAAAEQDKRYQPLADAMQEAAKHIGYFDFKGVNQAVVTAKDICRDV